MKLETGMWSLGVAIVAGCGSGGSADDCYGTPEGYSPACYEGDYEPPYDDYDDDGGPSQDDEDELEPACRSDLDCPLGYCLSSASEASTCVPLPKIPVCDSTQPLQLAWVAREGRAVGVVGRTDAAQRLLLIAEGDEAPAWLDAEADATPTELPIELRAEESVVGLEEADLDGDGDDDLLVTLSGEVRSRLVSLLQDEAGEYAPVDGLELVGPTGPASLRRDGDGGLEVYLRSFGGYLSRAPSRGDGTFAAPIPSPWGGQEVLDHVVAPLQSASHDDVLALVRENEDASAVVDGLIGGLLVGFGLPGPADRRIFADASRGYVVTVEPAGESAVLLERFFAGVDVDADVSVVKAGNATLLGSAMADFDGDGQGDLVLLRDQPQLHVVYGVSSDDACVATFDLESSFDAVLAPSSGTGRGVVLSGPDGVLAVR